MIAMWGKDALDALERDAWEHRLISLWEGLSWEEKTFIESHVQRQRFGQQLGNLNAMQNMSVQDQVQHRGLWPGIGSMLFGR